MNSSDWAVRPEVDCRYVTGAALTPRRRLVRWLVSKLRYAPGFETPIRVCSVFNARKEGKIFSKLCRLLIRCHS